MLVGLVSVLKYGEREARLTRATANGEYLLWVVGFLCVVLSLVSHRMDPDDSVYVNIAVAVSDDRLAVLYRACPRASGTGRTCHGRLVLASTAGEILYAEDVYRERDGLIELSYNPVSGKLLLLRHTDVAIQLGVWIATFDVESLSLSPWLRMGGTCASDAGAVAYDAGFAIAYEDRNPGHFDPHVETCTSPSSCGSATARTRRSTPSP